MNDYTAYTEKHCSTGKKVGKISSSLWISNRETFLREPDMGEFDIYAIQFEKI